MYLHLCFPLSCLWRNACSSHHLDTALVSVSLCMFHCVYFNAMVSRVAWFLQWGRVVYFLPKVNTVVMWWENRPLRASWTWAWEALNSVLPLLLLCEVLHLPKPSAILPSSVQRGTDGFRSGKLNKFETRIYLAVSRIQQAGICAGIQESSLYFIFIMRKAKSPNQLNKLPEALPIIYKSP